MEMKIFEGFNLLSHHLAIYYIEVNWNPLFVEKERGIVPYRNYRRGVT